MKTATVALKSGAAWSDCRCCFSFLSFLNTVRNVPHGRSPSGFLQILIAWKCVNKVKKFDSQYFRLHIKRGVILEKGFHNSARWQGLWEKPCLELWEWSQMMRSFPRLLHKYIFKNPVPLAWFCCFQATHSSTLTWHITPLYKSSKAGSCQSKQQRSIPGSPKSEPAPDSACSVRLSQIPQRRSSVIRYRKELSSGGY